MHKLWTHSLAGGLSFLSWALVSATAWSQSSVLKHEFIYQSAPFPECHAATIVQTKAGTLMTAWFGGTYEKHPDVGIWVSRYENNAWTAPVEVANGVQNDKLRYPTWNPVLFQPKDGPLALYFKVGPAPNNWWGEVITSSDDGRTWGNRQKLPNNGIGPVKNKPVQLADGTLLCPSSDEADGWTVHMESTSDAGKTWMKVGPLNDGKKIRAIQPTIVQLGGDKLGMLCRDGQADGRVWQLWSDDAGKSWSKFEASSLPNPNSGIDAVTLTSGKHLLVYNHTIRNGPSPKGREHLGLAVSDDAKDWQAVLTLEQSKGEYSYPAIIQTTDGLVHIVYTWNRKRVRHVVVDPAKLVAVPLADGKWPADKVAKLPTAQ
ncbi:MAG: exo-alpha-sialidase [Pirellulaceae bacterium]|nr:exo-alpha-sialidase [Pirellulaceae bacterium]